MKHAWVMSLIGAALAQSGLAAPAPTPSWVPSILNSEGGQGSQAGIRTALEQLQEAAREASFRMALLQTCSGSAVEKVQFVRPGLVSRMSAEFGKQAKTLFETAELESKLQKAEELLLAEQLERVLFTETPGLTQAPSARAKYFFHRLSDTQATELLIQRYAHAKLHAVAKSLDLYSFVLMGARPFDPLDANPTFDLTPEGHESFKRYSFWRKETLAFVAQTNRSVFIEWIKAARARAPEFYDEAFRSLMNGVQSPLAEPVRQRAGTAGG